MSVKQKLTEIVFLFYSITSICCGSIKLEVETSPSVNLSRVLMWRPLASEMKSVIMMNRDVIQYELCVKNPLKIAVQEIRYSNNMEPGILNILIDGQLAWSLNTVASPSNTFNTGRPVGESVLLVKGQYALSFEVVTNGSNWLEIDYITLYNPMGFIQTDLLCVPQNNTVMVEFENFSSLNGHDSYTMLRSNASEQKTILMYEGETISHNFCLEYNTKLTINDVVYGNDGGSDVVAVSVDNKLVDKFDTSAFSNDGFGWNDIKNSGQLGNTFSLGPGCHSVDVSIETADPYGIELDCIIFTIDTVSDSAHPFRCSSDVDLEAEEFHGGQLIKNLGSSGNFSLRINEGQILQKDFCLRSKTDVNFDKIFYTSNGYGQLVLKIDNVTVGRVSVIGSTSKMRNYIEVPLINNSLKAGKHSLEIVAEVTDKQGVELDFISLKFNSPDMYLTNVECLRTVELLLEAEEFPFGQSRGFRYRSNASGHKSIYLKQGDRIKRSICVQGRVKILLKNMLLSNDGHEDLVTVSLQPVNLISVPTSKKTNYGKYWNVVEKKETNSPFHLQTGKYELEVAAVKTDYYGVEVDALILEITSTDSDTFSLC